MPGKKKRFLQELNLSAKSNVYIGLKGDEGQCSEEE
jgi:hypothetical protein